MSAAEGEENSPGVDDDGPETACEPNLYEFCRFCGRDMAASSKDAQR